MRIEVTTLEAATPMRRAELLLSAREDQWFERKSFRISAEKLAAAIMGLANAEGGLIALGISEGQIEPPATTQTINEFRRIPLDWGAPAPRAHFTQLAVESAGMISEVLLIDVKPGLAVHETRAGQVYLRVGDSTVRLSAAQREELAHDRGGSHYEARPMAGLVLTDLDEGAVSELGSAIGSSLPPERILAARSLLTTRGDVTIAAYLLLSPRPHEQMPHAHVRVLRYLSPTAGTGSRQSLASDGDERIEGRIPEVLELASNRIEQWVPARRALGPSGKFENVPIVPRDAWLEGLVNAVVHRSYSMAGDHIRVGIFPDRIEIESPGRFPGIVDPEKPLEIARYARNPRIARVCNDLGITQEKGEGILRIFDEMRINGLNDPIYRQTSGSVRLTLLSTPRVAPHVEESLPTGVFRVMEFLRSAGRPLGTGEISEGIGLRRPATLRALKALQTIGEVEWRGNSPKDPRATWRLPQGQQELL